MNQLKYHVRITTTENMEVEIENEQFICIEHAINGVRMLTAFIGEGETSEKYKITISPHGEMLNIRKMAGSAVINASCLLCEDPKNEVVSNDIFLFCLDVNIYFADFAKSLLKK